MVGISFIIPVYNGETSIRNSIESICRWTKEPEIEILVVNDGSTDKTAEICIEIAKRDERIQVFSISNSGQSIARNYGMQRCKGKYICFVDADDRIDAEQVFLMLEMAEIQHADVVMGGYYRVNGGQKEQVHIGGEGIILRDGTPAEQALYHKVKTESAFGYLWNKLYRKAFLEKNHLQIDDIRKIYMEDQLFNLKVWSNHPVWYCCDRPVYYYETGNVSTTRKPEPKIHKKNVTMIAALISYLKENQFLEENLDLVIPLIMRTFCWSLVKNIDYEGRSRKRIKERAENYMESEEIQQVIQMKGSIKALFQLPSIFQKMFYMLCMLLIRGKMSGCAASIFLVAYPVMKKYISHVLK